MAQLVKMEVNNTNNYRAIKYILQYFLMFKSTFNSFYFIYVVIQHHQRNDQNTFYVPNTLLWTGDMNVGLWNLELQKKDVSPYEYTYGLRPCQICKFTKYLLY